LNILKKVLLGTIRYSFLSFHPSRMATSLQTILTIKCGLWRSPSIRIVALFLPSVMRNVARLQVTSPAGLGTKMTVLARATSNLSDWNIWPARERLCVCRRGPVGEWVPAQVSLSTGRMTSRSQASPLLEEEDQLLNTHMSRREQKSWSWFPTGLETKNYCAGEGQQQFSRSANRPTFCNPGWSGQVHTSVTSKRSPPPPHLCIGDRIDPGVGLGTAVKRRIHSSSGNLTPVG
jgi:hypothetical protein